MKVHTYITHYKLSPFPLVFFFTVFTVKSFPFFQSMWHLEHEDYYLETILRVQGPKENEGTTN